MKRAWSLDESEVVKWLKENLCDRWLISTLWPLLESFIDVRIPLRLKCSAPSPFVFQIHDLLYKITEQQRGRLLNVDESNDNTMARAKVICAPSAFQAHQYQCTKFSYKFLYANTECYCYFGPTHDFENPKPIWQLHLHLPHNQILVCAEPIWSNVGYRYLLAVFSPNDRTFICIWCCYDSKDNKESIFATIIETTTTMNMKGFKSFPILLPDQTRLWLEKEDRQFSWNALTQTLITFTGIINDNDPIVGYHFAVTDSKSKTKVFVDRIVQFQCCKIPFASYSRKFCSGGLLYHWSVGSPAQFEETTIHFKFMCYSVSPSDFGRLLGVHEARVDLPSNCNLTLLGWYLMPCPWKHAMYLATGGSVFFLE
jgi:hypothetical protein